MSKSRSKRKSKSLSAGATLLVVIIFAVIFAVSNFGNSDSNGNNEPAGEGILAVHYLDVGQGDSEFIELPDGKCMLIDASISEYGDDICSEISSFGYDEINYLVATHPHADHIGGMTEVVNTFDIEEIYMPRAATTSKTYEKLLTTISDKNLKINTAKAGKVIIDNDEIKVELLAPLSDNYDDLNNYSAVVKITYGTSSFLFMGDAENIVEQEIMDNSYNELQADILKVGHHGSSYSTSNEFLFAVNPQYAVISCGKDNSYGHPHKETLERLTNAGVTIFRTDKQGTITFYTNGDGSYEVDY